MSAAIVNPDASDVKRILSEISDPTPAAVVAPHTIKTNRNDAKHSEIIALLTKILKLLINKKIHKFIIYEINKPPKC